MGDGLREVDKYAKEDVQREVHPNERYRHQH
jgi:hypothetical protein